MEPLKESELCLGTTVFCWGLGAEGQLGVGASENSSIPLRSKISGKMVDVSAGGQFSAAVMEDGFLYMWGSNKKNQLSLENNQLVYYYRKFLW